MHSSCTQNSSGRRTHVHQGRPNMPRMCRPLTPHTHARRKTTAPSDEKKRRCSRLESSWSRCRCADFTSTNRDLHIYKQAEPVAPQGRLYKAGVECSSCPSSKALSWILPDSSTRAKCSMKGGRLEAQGFLRLPQDSARAKSDVFPI